MRILGIETSCDETAAAVIEGVVETPGGRFRQSSDQRISHVSVLSNVVSSQIEIHKKYGGVVPEVAAREHVVKILPVIDAALKKSSTSGIDRISGKISNIQYPPAAGQAITNKIPNLNFQINNPGIDAIAVTVGPGLITSLIVGVETAKTLAYVWGLPLVAVNHIEGHIYANFIDRGLQLFPALILTVSGGHTMLVLMEGHGKLEVVGDTLDDAAGEAFDKAAAMMKIGYPGGPAVAKMAEAHDSSRPFNPPAPLSKGGNRIVLPRPMMNKNNFDFSFSGLKTALLYRLEKDANWKKRVPEYCCEFQQAVIDVLVFKTIKAAKKYNVKTVMLAGGVAANTELRRQLADRVKFELPETALSIPDLKYTTDNAAMIAATGYFKALRKKFTPWWKLKADCNYKL